MRAAVEAIELGKSFPRKQVGQNILKRLFGRGKTKQTSAQSAASASDTHDEATAHDGVTSLGDANGHGNATTHDRAIARNETAAAAETDTIVAVKGVSFEVRPGEVFGFLGPNGAGKTTTIRMLSTLLEPSAGHAYICGHDVGTEAMEARAKLGAVLAGDRSLYWKLSGRENLEYFATLYRVPAQEIPKRIDEVLQRMHLSDRADEMVERYSTGMKQRLALARSLLADPPVLLLDEPTLGLDPQSARNLRDIVLELKDEGRAILLTTHYMEEADLLSDRIAIIDHGEIIALDTPARLKQSLSDERVYRMELALNGASGGDLNGNGIVANPGIHAESGTSNVPMSGTVAGLADRVPGFRVVESRNDNESGTVHISFTLDDAKVETARLWAALAETGTNVLNYAVEEPTLEDVFISLTGRGLRD